MKRSALVCVLVLFFMSLITYKASAQPDMSKDKQMIDDINKELEKYMVSGDYKGALKYYAEDAISLPSYQKMLRGKDAIEKQSMEDEKSGQKITSFDLQTSDVFGSGNLVYEVGTYKITMEMPNQKEPINDHGKYLTVYQKEDDGTLKIKAETWNSDMNPWMQMENGTNNNTMNDKDMDNKDK
ncbi:MAG TPA: nuclear transport factor 2 family protein [Ignavibacteriaceae bacterium]|nr:nuclear transport factor 2 family protein [Ignavibacteriaceae bacterium]